MPPLAWQFGSQIRPAILARVGEDYPQEWLDDFCQHGLDVRGVRILPEAVDLRFFAAFVDRNTRSTDDPVGHFARLGRPFPKALLGYRAATSAVDSRTRLQPISLRQGLYIPISLAGLTAPMTLPAAVAVTIAGVLGGLVLSQLVREGVPFAMPGWGGRAINMKTANYAYFTPDDRGIMASMAHYYKLPMFDLGGFSDSKAVDQQAGFEAAISLFDATLHGGNIIHDLGYLEAGLSGSLTQLLICDELISCLKHSSRELEVNEETLALDLIDQVGPEGQFLDTEHTLKHFRQYWIPDQADTPLPATTDWRAFRRFYKACRSPKQTAAHFDLSINTVKARVRREGW